jgi:hypothetical protein
MNQAFTNVPPLSHNQPVILSVDTLNQLQSNGKKTERANEEWPKILTEMMKQYRPLENVIDIVQATYELSP